MYKRDRLGWLIRMLCQKGEMKKKYDNLLLYVVIYNVKYLNKKK